jgi:hypothetical protein
MFLPTYVSYDRPLNDVTAYVRDLRVPQRMRPFGGAGREDRTAAGRYVGPHDGMTMLKLTQRLRIRATCNLICDQLQVGHFVGRVKPLRCVLSRKQRDWCDCDDLKISRGSVLCGWYGKPVLELKGATITFITD